MAIPCILFLYSYNDNVENLCRLPKRGAIGMKKRTRLLAFLLALFMLVTAFPLTALSVLADGANNETKEDAMTAIKADAELSAFKRGDTVRYETDGYIGIPVELTVYYDYAAFGMTNPGYNGTVTILYVVN